MKAPIPKVRSRRQRAFFAWLDEAAPRFRIPLRFQRRTDRRVEFTFSGIPPALYGQLTFDRPSSWCFEGNRRIRLARHSRGQVDIYTDWKGENWDELLWLDAIPVKTDGGYTCNECLPGHRAIFSNREALWRDHLFEPLVKWINEKLAAASALGLYRLQDKGGTWARLIGPGEDTEAECLAARLDF